jgi:hypothetical protein
VFVGSRTLIGPFYFGYGYAEGGTSSVYFSIGTIFGQRVDF